jgi:hypothetical protein
MRKEITALSTLRSLPYSKQELATQSNKQLSVGNKKFLPHRRQTMGQLVPEVHAQNVG